MKSLTKSVMLGLLLVPLAGLMMNNALNAYAAEQTVAIVANSQTIGCEVNEMCWDPSTITIAVGDTVTWVNEDSAGHLVTGASDATDPGTWGSLEVGGETFDSSFPLIAPGGDWSFTFTEAGEFPYVCQVHPHMIGKVIVVEGAMPDEEEEDEEEDMEGEMGEETMIPGEQIDLVVNHELPLDIAEYDEVMLTFKSKGSDGMPIVHTDYRVTVMKDGTEVFKHDFHDHDGVLELEFEQMDQAPMVMDPDVDDPGRMITGTFDVEGNVFAENGNYQIKAEITGIEFKALPTPITQDFSMTVVPEFPLAAILPLMLALAAIVAMMRIKSGRNFPSLK